jgi:3-hydroxybutyryl-CoA dehydrogenase
MAGLALIIASTTSTILADDLVGAVVHPAFLNAHWLNPAYLVPLVSFALGRNRPRCRRTDESVVAGDGKVPDLRRAARLHVPRIQALAMNEAARMVEEGVASAEDIDTAIKYGFGFRFAVLGMLEFIDWGGGTFWLRQPLSHPGARQRAHAAPEIVERNMREGRIGPTTRKGFLDYEASTKPSSRAARFRRDA